MQMNFIENNEDIEAMNGLQIRCIREFTGVENRRSFIEAEEACASTMIEYGGISNTAMALYDHIDIDVDSKKTSKLLSAFINSMMNRILNIVSGG